MFRRLKKSILKKIPAGWRHRLVELKNSVWGGWSHTYYSHSGEDIFIESFFRNQKKGFYVDVGAHHPKRYSNTAILYARGWSGINIDSDSYLIERFKNARRRDVNINCGVGLKEETKTFHVFSDPAVSTFSKANVNRLNEKHWLEEVKSIAVKIRPLHAILGEALPENTAIDLLNVDVEDLDLEALRSNDWEKYRPKLVAVEDLRFNPGNPTSSEIFTFMEEQEYVFVAYIGLTLMFVEKNLAMEKYKDHLEPFKKQG